MCHGSVADLQGSSCRLRRQADQLICCLRVIGAEVSWSEIMSCDWLRGFSAPQQLRVSAAVSLRTSNAEQQSGEPSADPQIGPVPARRIPVDLENPENPENRSDYLI